MNLRSELVYANLFLIFTTFFWGSTFVLVKATVEDVPLEGFLVVRFFLAFLVMALPRVIKHRSFSYTTSEIKIAMILGFLLFLSFWFQTIGLLYTTPANAAFVTGISVILVPIFNALRVKKLNISAMSLGILSIGGLILLSVDLAELQINSGDLIILGTAIAIALHIIGTDIVSKPNIANLVELQLLFIAIYAIIFGIPAQTLWNPFTIKYTPLLITTLFITSVLASAFAFWSQTHAQNIGVPSSQIAILFTLEPIFALLIDIMLGFAPSLQMYLGMTLILMAMVFSTFIEFNVQNVDE